MHDNYTINTLNRKKFIQLEYNLLRWKSVVMIQLSVSLWVFCLFGLSTAHTNLGTGLTTNAPASAITSHTRANVYRPHLHTCQELQVMPHPTSLLHACCEASIVHHAYIIEKLYRGIKLICYTPRLLFTRAVKLPWNYLRTFARLQQIYEPLV